MVDLGDFYCDFLLVPCTEIKVFETQNPRHGFKKCQIIQTVIIFFHIKFSKSLIKTRKPLPSIEINENVHTHTNFQPVYVREYEPTKST